ncbi:MAG: LPXTG cell wall anchor domain-containing protein [Nocardioidaceae bacterium]
MDSSTQHSLKNAPLAILLALFLSLWALAPAQADDGDSGSRGGTHGKAGTSEDADDDEAGSSSAEAGKTCDKLGYTKVDQSSGTVELESGTLTWSGDTLTYDIDTGYTVDLCIKSGVKQPITTFVVEGASQGSKQIEQDISHIGYIENGAAEAGDDESGDDEAGDDDESNGPPCDGCVGEADDKSPKGQMPDGSDNNAGYECDTNKGVGQGNPAHTGCEGAATGEEPGDGEDAAGEEAADAEVLGVSATAAEGDPAAAAADQTAQGGLLPATGANGPLTYMLLGGLGLLAIGGGVLLRARRLRLGS